MRITYKACSQRTTLVTNVNSSQKQCIYLKIKRVCYQVFKNILISIEFIKCLIKYMNIYIRIKNK